MKLIKAEKTENKLIPVKEGFGKLGASLKKNLKRNLVVIGSVLLIGGAVWLNWTLFSDAGDDDYDPSYYTSGDVQNGGQNGNNSGKAYRKNRYSNAPPAKMLIKIAAMRSQ